MTSFSDVTAEREDSARLAEAQRRFQLAFDQRPDRRERGLPRGEELLQVNRALCRDHRLLRGGDAGHHLPGAELPERPRGANRAAAQAGLGGVPAYQMEKSVPAREQLRGVGAACPSHSCATRTTSRSTSWAEILDVTDRRRLERELRHQAEHDDLTQAPQQRSRSTAVWVDELARERRYGGESCLLMIDLDRFKEINDTIGHGAGDDVLRAVAGTISERIRDTDVAARLGGDEFAVLLPGADRQGGEILAIEHVVQAIRELRVPVGATEPAAVTASVEHHLRLGAARGPRRGRPAGRFQARDVQRQADPAGERYAVHQGAR